MLLAGGEPDDVAGSDLLDGSTLALHPAEAGDDDQRLPERVCVPGGPGAGLERHLSALHSLCVKGIEERVHPDRACKPRFRTLAGQP
jgi:hypothetical protein